MLHEGIHTCCFLACQDPFDTEDRLNDIIEESPAVSKLSVESGNIIFGRGSLSVAESIGGWGLSVCKRSFFGYVLLCFFSRFHFIILSSAEYLNYIQAFFTHTARHGPMYGVTVISCGRFMSCSKFDSRLWVGGLAYGPGLAQKLDS